MIKPLGRIGEVLRYRALHAIDRFVGIPLVFLCFPFRLLLRKRPQLSEACGYRKILIVKLSLMGDTILLVPALRVIREKFPQARISVIHSQVNAEILKDCPYIDEKIIAPFGKLLNPFYFWGLIGRLRKAGFDLAIDFEQWFRVSALISFLSKAGERIGFKTLRQYRHYLFTKIVEHRKDMHELESFLDLSRALGIEAANKNLELWPQEENQREAADYLRRLGVNSDFMILHTEVSATGRQRQWPIDNFAQLGKRIRGKHNLKILIASSAGGSREAEKLKYLLSGEAGLLIGVDLLTLFVIASRARLVVTNNTGFMHLVAGAGAAVIGLHGPTSPVKWGPWGKNSIAVKSGLPCSPCLYLGFEYGCKTNKCMQEIQVDEVLSQADKILGASIS